MGVERDVAGGSGKSRVRVDLYLEHKLVLSCEELQAIFDRLLAEEYLECLVEQENLGNMLLSWRDGFNP